MARSLLCHLLEYLATHSVDEQGSSVKEYQIATEVFGRSADFDPRLDSTVRVQTSRLRAKLAEYYAGPGAQDEVIVEIPKGAYSVVVHARPAAAEVVPQLEAGRVDVAPASRRYSSEIAVWMLAVSCCGLLLALMYAPGSHAAGSYGGGAPGESQLP